MSSPNASSGDITGVEMGSEKRFSPDLSVSTICVPYNTLAIASPTSIAPVPCALSFPKISTQLLYSGIGLPLNFDAARCAHRNARFQTPIVKGKNLVENPKVGNVGAI
ncbi:hypothetical protein CDL12_19757 [Handroanthus impetiginosus]|uniref:Uncharacterized protein n=1 Tax=Handroanthus impetiginosus TaxID=429701 RepID=A0A2G9GQU7_9LAMI|nr:hypothetical protein CDL12_19757 [Handroanthus impetiginosus]